jgi:hypothetical protein
LQIGGIFYCLVLNLTNEYRDSGYFMPDAEQRKTPAESKRRGLFFLPPLAESGSGSFLRIDRKVPG